MAKVGGRKARPKENRMTGGEQATSQVLDFSKLTPEQLQGLAQALSAYQKPAAKPAEEGEGRRKTASCNFAEMSVLTANEGQKTDRWFEAYEVRCRNAKLPKSEWGAALLECPKVDAAVRAFLTRKSSEDPTGGYDYLRKAALEQYAPSFPTGVYRYQLSMVKGTTRKEVQDQVDHLTLLHDRAAADAGMPPIHPWDVIPAVIRAFPPRVSRELASHAQSLKTATDPLGELFKKCPEDEEAQSPATALLAGMSEHADMVPREEVAALAAAMARQARSPQKAEKKRATCYRCGSATCNFSRCPAKNETCTKCNKKGHRANCCRGTASGNDRQPVKDPNHPFQ